MIRSAGATRSRSEQRSAATRWPWLALARLTTPDGTAADIDVEIVPLVRALWRIGLVTTASCQDFGEGTAGHGAPTRAPLVRRRRLHRLLHRLGMAQDADTAQIPKDQVPDLTRTLEHMTG